VWRGRVQSDRDPVLGQPDHRLSAGRVEVDAVRDGGEVDICRTAVGADDEVFPRAARWRIVYRTADAKDELEILSCRYHCADR
jgi:hypothetical protein